MIIILNKSLGALSPLTRAPAGEPGADLSQASAPRERKVKLIYSEMRRLGSHLHSSLLTAGECQAGEGLSSAHPACAYAWSLQLQLLAVADAIHPREAVWCIRQSCPRQRAVLHCAATHLLNGLGRRFACLLNSADREGRAGDSLTVPSHQTCPRLPGHHQHRSDDTSSGQISLASRSRLLKAGDPALALTTRSLADHFDPPLLVALGLLQLALVAVGGIIRAADRSHHDRASCLLADAGSLRGVGGAPLAHRPKPAQHPSTRCGHRHGETGEPRLLLCEREGCSPVPGSRHPPVPPFSPLAELPTPSRLKEGVQPSGGPGLEGQCQQEVDALGTAKPFPSSGRGCHHLSTSPLAVCQEQGAEVGSYPRDASGAFEL